MPHELIDDMINRSEDFFDLEEEEKQEYAGKTLFDPIRCGTSFNVKVDTTLLWRDYLKIHVHPHFNAPKKPAGFRYFLINYIDLNRSSQHPIMLILVFILLLMLLKYHQNVDLAILVLIFSLF